MALFIDAGKVAPRFSDLDLRGPERPPTASACRFTRRPRTVTRIELARTREGNSLVVLVQPELLSRYPHSSATESEADHDDQQNRQRSLAAAGAAVTVAAATIASDPPRRPDSSTTTRLARRGHAGRLGMKPLEVDLVVDLAPTSCAARTRDRRPREEHQYRRRSARLELVHQPRRRAGRSTPRTSRRARHDAPAGRRHLDRHVVEERRRHARLHRQGRDRRSAGS